MGLPKGVRQERCFFGSGNIGPSDTGDMGKPIIAMQCVGRFEKQMQRVCKQGRPEVWRITVRHEHIEPPV